MEGGGGGGEEEHMLLPLLLLLRPWKKWILPLGFLLFCLYMAARVLDFLWWRPKRLEKQFAKQGIRGPPYKFFLGNVREMVGLMMEAASKPMVPPWSHDILPRVLAFYPHWKKIYGPTFLLWFGPTARLAVSDPELIREILVSRSEYYDRYESHPMVRQLEGEGLVSLTGEKWAHHRKLITPTFHMDNLKLLIPLIGRTVEDMVGKWTALPASSSGGEVEVDVSEWYQSLAEDAITQTAFGTSYEDGKAIFQLQAKKMAFAAEAFQNVFIPGYRFLPTQKNMDSWKIDREINKSLARLIGIRKQSLSNDANSDEKVAIEGGSSIKDLLGLLISANSNKKGRNSSGGITIRAATTSPRNHRSTTPLSSSTITVHDIVEECKTFFFAGKHTTSNLLTWATLMLAMHPEWQERARDEVLTVCGSRDPPTRDHLSKLKTVGMVLYETLRLYPPAVATIRRAKVDVELGGAYTVPRGTELLIPIMPIHHDPEMWGPDVSDFNPARFSNGVARAARHPTAFIPFGLGARTCIGQNLALLEAKLTLAIVLQHFSFRLSPSYIHAPTVLMLLYPQYGAPLLFRPLSRS